MGFFDRSVPGRRTRASARLPLALAGLLLIATGAATRAEAASHAVGVEWENSYFDVVAPSDITILTNGKKRLLCTGKTVKAFKEELPLMTVTYDLVLDKPENTRARLEISTGPVPLCDAGTWSNISVSLAALRASMPNGLPKVLDKLTTAAPDLDWQICPEAAAYAKDIKFESGTKRNQLEWDTQVNFQVALEDLMPEVYPAMFEKEGYVLPLKVAAASKVLTALKRVLGEHSFGSLDPKGIGILYVYYLARLLPGIDKLTDPTTHSDIKGRFGFYPKVTVSSLAPYITKAFGADRDNGVRNVITQFSTDVLGYAGLKKENVLADEIPEDEEKEIPSFEKDTDPFGTRLLSNPIEPYEDSNKRVFIVLETRYPKNVLASYLTPDKNGVLDPKGLPLVDRELKELAVPDKKKSSKCLLN